MTGGPVRFRLSRAKGWRMPPNGVKVDRSTGHGNPYRVERVDGQWWVLAPSRRPVSGPYDDKRDAQRDAVDAFRAWLMGGTLVAQRRYALAREELRGRDLGCWCAEGDPCHADVLLDVVND